jgi:mono/diheme cytochrome c family protein
MPIHHLIGRLFVLIRSCKACSLPFLIVLGAQQLSMPTPIRAQGNSFESRQRFPSRMSASSATGTSAARALFGQRCVTCHGADGKGSLARGLLPEIPNFTAASWQRQRSDAQLMASILDGKGQGMPPVRGKIGEEQARGLVAHVRSFASTTANPATRQQQDPGLASFNERYLRLHQEMDELRRQYHQLPPVAPGGAPSRASESGQTEVARRLDPSTPGPPVSRALFGQRCVKCHGTDGTGSPARGLLPEIPDSTAPSWQAQRSDAQLMASILNGKGQGMPPVRGKIGEEQARSLVAHVRSFASTPAGSEQRKHERPAPARAAEAEPPRRSLGSLIGWLGEFHSRAVHLPTGLVTVSAARDR